MLKDLSELKARIIELPEGLQGILLLEEGFWTKDDINELVSMKIYGINVGVKLCRDINKARLIRFGDKPAIDTGAKS